jgi:hypothetical protein
MFASALWARFMVFEGIYYYFSHAILQEMYLKICSFDLF